MLSEDKIYHLVVTLVIGVAFGYYYSNFLSGVGASALIGVAKEFYDKQYPNHTEDINDIYADIVGGVIGSVIGVGLTYL